MPSSRVVSNGNAALMATFAEQASPNLPFLFYSHLSLAQSDVLEVDQSVFWQSLAVVVLLMVSAVD